MYHHAMNQRRSGSLFTWLGSAALVLPGCAPKPGDSASETGTFGSEVTGVSPTDATPTDATATDAATATTGSPTSDAPGTSAGSSTSEATTGTATTGTDEGLPGACQAYCERFLECAPRDADPVEICVPQCQQGFQGAPMCSEAATGLLECVANLTCEQFVAFVADDEIDPCIEQVAALEDVCGPGCLMSGSGGPGGCSLGRICGDQDQDYQCMDDTCTCVENDVPGATCPAAGFCELDEAAQVEVIKDCCGWDWP